MIGWGHKVRGHEDSRARGSWHPGSGGWRLNSWNPKGWPPWPSPVTWN